MDRRQHERGQQHTESIARGAAAGTAAYVATPASALPPIHTVSAQSAMMGLGGVRGCTVCGVLCFTSEAKRFQHERDEQHLRRVKSRNADVQQAANARRLDDADGSNSLPTSVERLELRAELGVAVIKDLFLKNPSNRTWSVSVVIEPPVERLQVVGGPTPRLPAGVASVAVVALQYHPQHYTESVEVVVAFSLRSVPNAAEGASDGIGTDEVIEHRVACSVRLSCFDPRTVEDIKDLQPTSRHVRKRRRRNLFTGTIVNAPSQNDQFYWRPAPVSFKPTEALLRRNDLGQLDAIFDEPLRAGTHASRFKQLLLCEEVAARDDMSDFDLEGVELTPVGHCVRLTVNGLAESRPSLRPGDTIIAKRANDKQAFRGRIKVVALTSIDVHFDSRLRRTSGMWNIHFELSRMPYLIQHAAIAETALVKGVREALLFAPRPADNDAAVTAVQVLQSPLPSPLHNRALNQRQQAAVQGALFRPQPNVPVQPPFIIFGPPGTGKTSTLVEYILQVVASAKARGISAGAAVLILVAAPSNAAVDEISRRLVEQDGPLAPRDLMRVNAYNRDPRTVPESLAACIGGLRGVEKDGTSGYRLPTREELRDVWVVTATNVTAQKLIQTLRLETNHELFSHIVVDEAGQATEPECLCAVSGALRASAGGRVVLAGDPRQLGPILRSTVAARHGLSLSLLERLTGDKDRPHWGDPVAAAATPDPNFPLGFHPAYVSMLTHNYRSHPALLNVPNALFYANALVPSVPRGNVSSFENWPGLTIKARAVLGGFPLLFHGVHGTNQQEGDSPSWFNPEEAVAVIDHIESVLVHGGGRLKPASIGVITPYHKQVLKLRQLLRKKRPDLVGDVAIGSVEVFQGGEREVMIVSTVRSSADLLEMDARHALGFVGNPKRFNVAVTRAKQLLVVVGNPAVLALDDAWSALLRYAVAHGAYRGVDLPAGFDSISGNLGIGAPHGVDRPSGSVLQRRGGGNLNTIEDDDERERPAWGGNEE